MVAEAEGEPVTVVVRRRVKPGKELGYEGWLDRLIKEAASLPGYLGTTIHRPSAGREYTSVFRFDSVEHLRGFEESELRARTRRSRRIRGGRRGVGKAHRP